MRVSRRRVQERWPSDMSGLSVGAWQASTRVGGSRPDVGAGVEIEEVGADGDAEMLLAFEFEGSVGQVGEGEVGGGFVGFGEPALMGRGGSFCHGA